MALRACVLLLTHLLCQVNGGTPVETNRSLTRQDRAEGCDTSMKVGATVVRNDLDWKYGDQDGGSGNKGKVLSLDAYPGYIIVKWENEKWGKVYRWGNEGKNDVKIYCEDGCDTSMTAGSKVVRDDVDWIHGDQDGGRGSIGTIARKEVQMLHVTWDGNGQTHGYRWGWGKDGKTDVKPYCPVRCEVQLTVKTANAINNYEIGGVLVNLLQHGSTVDKVTTDSSGQRHMTSPRGQVVLKAELEGFTMAPVTITVGEEECEKTIKLSLSPETSDPAQVVMNWVHDPKDLDLHVKQLRGGSEVCHCYYQHKQCDGFGLDVDNTNYGEHGAETITWTESDQSSQYLVFVLDYTNGATHISQSGARIALYNEGQDPTTINVPANGSSNRYWKVGCFNSIGFTLINQIVSSEPNSC